MERVFNTRIFDGNVWGLQWFANDGPSKGLFPQYYKHDGEERVAVAAADVPAETGLLTKEFKLATLGKPYTSPARRSMESARFEAWTVHGQTGRWFSW